MAPTIGGCCCAAGACHVRREAIVTNLDAAQFDRDLDIAEARIRREADVLGHEQLAEQGERFVTALELDLIDAEDFARSLSGHVLATACGMSASGASARLPTRSRRETSTPPSRCATRRSSSPP